MTILPKGLATYFYMFIGIYCVFDDHRFCLRFANVDCGIHQRESCKNKGFANVIFENKRFANVSFTGACKR